MKYICPICEKRFDVEEEVTKHFLKCWKENNPHHKSKLAPRSEDKNIVEVNEDIAQFFNSWKGENNDERNIS